MMHHPVPERRRLHPAFLRFKDRKTRMRAMRAAASPHLPGRLNGPGFPPDKNWGRGRCTPLAAQCGMHRGKHLLGGNDPITEVLVGLHGGVCAWEPLA